MPTNTQYDRCDHDRQLNLTWITYRRREAQRLSFRYYYRRVLVVGNCAFQMTRRDNLLLLLAGHRTNTSADWRTLGRHLKRR